MKSKSMFQPNIVQNYRKEMPMMISEDDFSTDQAEAALQMLSTARHGHDAEFRGYSVNP